MPASLIVLLLAIASATGAITAELTNARPVVLAFYHPWYGTPWGPSGQWRKWDSFAFPKRYDPERVRDGWRRDIASMDYPLVGPHDSSDPEIVRWHFRLAKAAGIDGFLCSWWKVPRPDATWDWQYQLFDRVLLKVAEEEKFQVAVIDECAHYIRNYDQLVARITNHLPAYARSPAYLRIDGQPVWFVYQVWDDWLKADAAARYVRAAEAQVDNVFWIFDKMRATAIAEEPRAKLYVPADWLAIREIDCFGSYSLFGNWRETNASALTQLYTGFATNVRSAGKKVQLPVSPGHDNTPVNDKPYIAPRADGKTLRAFLAAADAARPDVVVVCSFNEWLETTQIEPSRTWHDPYLYLKALAQWRGREWKQPPLPPKTSWDPLLRDATEPTAFRTPAP